MNPHRLTAVLALLALGTAAAGIAQAQALPDRIAKAKVLKIGVNPIYPPMEYRDPESGKLVGFDVDLANALAKELGIGIAWQEAGFDQLLPSLTTGRIDLILSGLSDNAERRTTADFIDYLNSGAQFFTSVLRRDINQPQDLCGRTVGTSRSTTFPNDVKNWSDTHCVAAGKPAIRVEGTNDNAAARSELKQGRLDAAAQGSETVPYVMVLEPGVYKSIGGPFGGVPQGIAFTKADVPLRNAVLAAFKKVLANGAYTAIIARWNLQASAVTQAAVNGAPATP
ncbi:MAG: ABC transporter substrate-binding protein [Steroidobacteraceae bacterium]